MSGGPTARKATSVAGEDGDAVLEPRLAASRDAATCPDCGALCGAGADALYRAYSGRLLQFVRQYGAERGLSESQLDAEGVVHETFEAMLRHKGLITYPPAWLYAVARRHVARIHGGQRRHGHRDPGRLIDGASADVRWTSLAPSAPVEYVVATRAVMDAIAALPDHQRAATYFRQVEGWSLSEIGSYLDCAPATAGVHVHRGTRTVAKDPWTQPALRLSLPRGRAPYPERAYWAYGPPPASRSAPCAVRHGRVAVIAVLVVTGVAAGLLYMFGAPWLLVLAGSLAPVALTATGARLRSWRGDRKLLRQVRSGRRRSRKTAAELSRIAREFPGWSPWVSDAGHWWATRKGRQPVNPAEWWSMTVDADDADRLREAIGRQERLANPVGET